jgi:hypothetical protein
MEREGNWMGANIGRFGEKYIRSTEEIISLRSRS